MESGNFKNAIQYYEALEARFPFANQSKQAQLDLIYCYYNDRQIEATVDAASTFERENPTHPRVDYALYMRGLAYFSGQSSWYHRWFNADLSERPPKNLQESFSAFAQLIQRFPNSAYAADARQRMVFLRNRLADYELLVARYYMSRGAWLAAASRARFIVEQYDGAPAVADSLKIMLDAYRELGMTDQAADVRLVIASNYPDTLRQARPKARPEILTPGGAWRRLYSARRTISSTRTTTSRSKPCAAISSTERLSRISASRIASSTG
jgi:outer membrane protein assembly factor BamD